MIIGNSRCSLTGADLDRQWQLSDSKFYPANYYTKQLLTKTKNCRELYLFCDFHGHSTAHNVFLCGNNQNKYPNKEKEFARLFSVQSDFFSFDQCKFDTPKHRESCASVVVGRLFNLINSFTAKCSFLGPD